MISLGIVDLILLALFVLAIYLAIKGRGMGLSVLVALVLVVVLSERLAPGSLARLGTDIRGIDQINSTAPHVTIQPIVRFEK
jgi:hypothetical protein